MIKSSISADMLGLSLRQMGANIQVNSSKYFLWNSKSVKN